MTIKKIKSIRYEYECPITKNIYVEQRDEGVDPYFTISPAGAEYILVNETESFYEIEIPDLIIADETLAE